MNIEVHRINNLKISPTMPQIDGVKDKSECTYFKLFYSLYLKSHQKDLDN